MYSPPVCIIMDSARNVVCITVVSNVTEHRNRSRKYLQHICMRFSRGVNGSTLTVTQLPAFICLYCYYPHVWAQLVEQLSVERTKIISFWSEFLYLNQEDDKGSCFPVYKYVCYITENNQYV